jgi:probable HAF family extracellular repeat protein
MGWLKHWLFVACITAFCAPAPGVVYHLDDLRTYTGGTFSWGTFTYPFGSSNAKAINASGHFSGYISDSANEIGYVYANGALTALATPGVGQAEAINTQGDVAGWENRSGSVVTAYVYQNGTVTWLPSLGGISTRAKGINDNGQVVGSSTLSNGEGRAFSYLGGVITNLGTLGGNSSSAEDVNATGVIVGESKTTGALTHAFSFSGGTMSDLGTLGRHDELRERDQRQRPDRGLIADHRERREPCVLLQQRRDDGSGDAGRHEQPRVWHQ